MTHFRTGTALVLAAYVVQGCALLLAAFSPGLLIVEILIGALLLPYVGNLARRITLVDDHLEISGFFLGGQPEQISAADLVSIRYFYVHQQLPGRPSWDISIFELHAQNSRYYYPIPSWGWSRNRSLFVHLNEMIAQSSLSVDARTQRALDAASQNSR